MRNTMKKLKRYYELLQMTLQNGRVLFHEYKTRKFHPQYLNELLSGKYLLFHPERIMAAELGEKNKNRIVAYIKLDKDWIPTAGFFALMHKTLCGLYYADKMGFLPVVANWDECAYEEEGKVNGTNNVFEYYFQRACGVSVSDALNSSNVVVPSEANMNIIFSTYGGEWFHLTEKYTEKMGEIYRKYVRLNSRVKTRMESDIDTLLRNKKTLAVHFRGTDHRINADGHPMSLELEDYDPYIRMAVKKFGYEQIFIATDDMTALDKIKRRFDHVICYADVTRTDGDVSVAFLENNSSGHKYQLGYEVLRDAYTIAACDGFIGGNSQVAVGARFIKASVRQKYKYCKIIEKGINRNGKDWVKIFHETIKK